MLAGLLIYAISLTQAPYPRQNGEFDRWIDARPVKAVAFALSLLLVLRAGGGGRDRAAVATADDTAKILAGMPPSAGLAARHLHQGRKLAAARQALRRRLGRARQAPALQDQGVVDAVPAAAQAGRVLHVQRAGLPLRRRLLSGRRHLRHGRARAGRRDPRPHRHVERDSWRAASAASRARSTRC